MLPSNTVWLKFSLSVSISSVMYVCASILCPCLYLLLK